MYCNCERDVVALTAVVFHEGLRRLPVGSPVAGAHDKVACASSCADEKNGGEVLSPFSFLVALEREKVEAGPSVSSYVLRRW